MKRMLKTYISSLKVPTNQFISYLFSFSSLNRNHPLSAPKPIKDVSSCFGAYYRVVGVNLENGNYQKVNL
jgi:hypothetical protein